MNYTELRRMPKNSTLVYRIVNTVSGHSYVGSTIEPKRRWANHKKLLSDKKHTSFLLQRAWDKYGKDALFYEALFVCPEEMRFDYECRALSLFGDYNLIKDAGQPPAGSMAGLKHTQEGLKNLSASATRRWAKIREQKYDPLCEKAWELVKKGMKRSLAHKEVGISHSTFWNWITKNNLKMTRKK